MVKSINLGTAGGQGGTGKRQETSAWGPGANSNTQSIVGNVAKKRTVIPAKNQSTSSKTKSIDLGTAGGQNGTGEVKHACK